MYKKVQLGILGFTQKKCFNMVWEEGVSSKVVHSTSDHLYKLLYNSYNKFDK